MNYRHIVKLVILFKTQNNSFHFGKYCFFFIASKIHRHPIVGDIVAVKCVDKFYRGQIIDVLDISYFYLYLIDAGSVVSASIDCLADLSNTLKEV